MFGVPRSAPSDASSSKIMESEALNGVHDVKPSGDVTSWFSSYFQDK